MLTIDLLVGTQVYVSKEVAASVGGFGALTSSGTSVLVQGLLRETPPGTMQVCCPTPHCCSAACVELVKGTTNTGNNTTRNTFRVRCEHCPPCAISVYLVVHLHPGAGPPA